MKKLSLVACFLLAAQFSYTQKIVNSSGGSASSSNGAISYSIGQVFYSSSSVSNGETNQGVQHGFEILTLSNPELKTVTLNLSTYPNPTKDNIILNIDIKDLNNFSYQLFDVKGQCISNGKVKKEKTTISLINLSTGIYILKVLQKTNQLKTFKIIKQ